MKKLIFPKVGTMPSRALSLLLQGKRITHKEFWLHAGSYRLSASICTLRALGWVISDIPEIVKTSDPTKRDAHIKRYYLTQGEISLAGAGGRAYVQKIHEWHRFRATGQAATSPADKVIGTIGQEADIRKHSMNHGQNQPNSV